MGGCSNIIMSCSRLGSALSKTNVSFSFIFSSQNGINKTTCLALVWSHNLLDGRGNLSMFPKVAAHFCFHRLGNVVGSF